MTRKRILCTASTFLDFSLITLLYLFDVTLMPSLSKFCAKNGVIYGVRVASFMSG